MTVDRSVLLAYLRQRADVGERSLLLENLSRTEAMATLRDARAPSPARVATPKVTNTPNSLQVLQAEAATCTRCRLHETRTTVVFGEGNPNADVMVVGEAPGQEEDRSGRPFVGQ